MAKIKYNVKGVESRGERQVPKPGVYRAKITSCVDAKPEGKDRRLEVQYTIQGGDYNGAVIYDYINLESEAAAWKLRQFLEAVGLVTDKKETGTLDPDDLVGTALSIKTKVQPETEQWPAKAVASLLMPLDGDEEDEDLSDDDDDAGDDDADDADDEASDDDDSDEDGDDEDEAWTEDELTELDDDDLLLYAYGGEDEDGDEVEGLLDEDDDETGREAFLSEKKKGKKKVVTLDREGLIAAMLEAQEDEDDGDEDDGEEPPDYDSMDLPELKKLAKERKLSDKGSKKVIIARLQKDDNPF